MNTNSYPRFHRHTLLPLILVISSVLLAHAQTSPKPLRALLITGGCCHSYATQQHILKKGIEARAHVIVDQVHSDDTSNKHPTTRGFKDWATGPEELYNNVQIFPTATAIASGSQRQPERKRGENVIKAQDAEAVVVWTNDYQGTRVFCTTIGHYDETVEDDRYLDLVTRGLLWSCKKLNKKYLK